MAAKSAMTNSQPIPLATLGTQWCVGRKQTNVPVLVLCAMAHSASSGALEGSRRRRWPHSYRAAALGACVLCAVCRAKRWAVNYRWQKTCRHRTWVLARGACSCPSQHFPMLDGSGKALGCASRVQAMAQCWLSSEQAMQPKISWSPDAISCPWPLNARRVNGAKMRRVYVRAGFVVCAVGGKPCAGTLAYAFSHATLPSVIQHQHHAARVLSYTPRPWGYPVAQPSRPGSLTILHFTNPLKRHSLRSVAIGPCSAPCRLHTAPPYQDAYTSSGRDLSWGIPAPSAPHS